MEEHAQDMRDGHMLLEAVRDGDKELVLSHVRHHADVNVTDANGENCLHLACHLGDSSIVEILVTLPNVSALVDAPNKLHDTPVQLAHRKRARNILHLMRTLAPPTKTAAAKPGTRAVVRDQDCDSMQRGGPDAEAAEHEAVATSCCPNCLKKVPKHNLISHQMHCERHLVRCTMCDKLLPVAQADEHARLGMADALSPSADERRALCDVLERHGVLDVHAANDNGDTLLHLSVRAAECDVVQFLLERGASTSTPNRLHDTPAQVLLLARYLHNSLCVLCCVDGHASAGRDPQTLCAATGLCLAVCRTDAAAARNAKGRRQATRCTAACHERDS